MQEEEVPPSVNLLESMRSVGYSFEAALADLIDNSLAKGATLVDIDGDVLDGEFLAVLDNGEGMSPETAREALQLAGTTGERDATDLGRFGLGLKTASLSQARCLTVVTRKNGVTTGLCWDIDHVVETGRWGLLVLSPGELESIPIWREFNRLSHGTLVVWTHLDLLHGDAGDRGEHLRERLMGARESLSLVFHRFLRAGEGDFSVRINGAKLSPIDPFIESNTRVQKSPTELVHIRRAIAEVTAFTLPHPSGLTPAERARPDLSTGMRDAQGFYVYRNRRLIAQGSWFGLAPKSELTKQTRIRVDLPNSIDNLWQLDIKKSRVEPPASFRAHLKRILDPILERGRRVTTYRGRKASESHITRVWTKHVDDRTGSVRYEANPEHPLLVLFRDQLSEPQADAFDAVLDLLSASYPANDLYAELAASKLASRSDVVVEDVAKKLALLLEAGALGTNATEATAMLSNVEPFNQVPDLLEQILAVMETGGRNAVQ